MAQDFWAWADWWLERHRQRGHIYYWRRSRATLRKLERSAGRPLPWQGFDVNALSRFDQFMEQSLGNKANTRRTAPSAVRTMVNDAVRQGAIEPGKNPFMRFRMPKSQPVHRAKLSKDDLMRMEGLVFPEGSIQGLARDLFVFAVHGRGLLVLNG
jgi:Phage integrase SAM-like domain